MFWLRRLRVRALDSAHQSWERVTVCYPLPSCMPSRSEPSALLCRNMGPNDCWWAWLLMTIQTMVGLLMDAVMIGEPCAAVSPATCPALVV